MSAPTSPTPDESPTPSVGLSPVVGMFLASDGAAHIYELEDGRAVHAGVTGSMLLTSVGGTFVRFLDEVEALRLDHEAAMVEPWDDWCYGCDRSADECVCEVTP